MERCNEWVGCDVVEVKLRDAFPEAFQLLDTRLMLAAAQVQSR
jgi:hypothetical protein